MLAQAEVDATDIRSRKKQLRPDGTLLFTNVAASQPCSDHRIEPTLAFETALEFGNRAALARSEVNAAKAILFAEEQLVNDAQIPSDRDVEEDWLFAWREYAGKVSTEDLQRIWGAVLAGEVKAPGKYSMRTLEFLKTISRTEAEMISKLASYVIGGVIARGQKNYSEDHGLSFSFLLQMQELGMISGVEALNLQIIYKSTMDEKFLLALNSHSKALLVEHGDASKILELEVYKLTPIGKQVLGLGAFEPDIEYLQRVGEEITRKGFSVKLTDWQNVSDTEGLCFNMNELSGATHLTGA